MRLDRTHVSRRDRAVTIFAPIDAMPLQPKHARYVSEELPMCEPSVERSVQPAKENKDVSFLKPNHLFMYNQNDQQVACTSVEVKVLYLF